MAEDLSPYQLCDIEWACAAIASKPRQQGETAFPESAVLVEMTRSACFTRENAEKRARRERREAEELARREELLAKEAADPVPESEREIAARLQRLIEAKSMDAPPRAKVELLHPVNLCVKCAAEQYQPPTPAEARALADYWTRRAEALEDAEVAVG